MRRILAILIACLAITIVHAQHKTFTRKEGFFSPADRINAYFFDSSRQQMVVRDEGDISAPVYGSLDAAMRKSPCLAGVNGGFFGADKTGTPLGMVVQDGRRIHPLETGSFTVSGIIYDTGKTLHLVRSRDFAALRKKPGIRSAMQGGPFLVENGRQIKGLNDTRKTYRTFIATDGGTKWCIGTTSSLTLRELSDWLLEQNALGDFRVKTALNLDGGTSAAFWCHPSGIYHPSIKQVRNYIGIAPRQ